MVRPERMVAPAVIRTSSHLWAAAGFGGRNLHTDLFGVTAAYLFHITQNHPFIDGNKRTGTVASLALLSLNDVEIEANEEKFERTVLGVAQGKLDRA